MKTKHLCALYNIALGATVFLSGFAVGTLLQMDDEPRVETVVQVEKEIETKYVSVPEYKVLEVVKPVERVPETNLTDEEKILIARVVCAEAGTEDLIGKRLVVDTVLNRVDKIGFGDTVEAVVYGQGQYYMAGSYTDECMKAVEMECWERLDYDIVWFCNSGWMPYGTPAFQHGGHWFNWYTAIDNEEDIKMGGAGYGIE